MSPRRRRLLLLGSVLALLVAGGAALGVLAARRALEPARVEALLHESLGVPVRVGAVELGLLPPRIVVRGVEAPPALRVARAALDPDLSALLGGTLALAEIHLEGAEVALLRPTDEGGLALATGGPEGTPLPWTAGEDDERPPPEALPALDVRDASLTLEDARGEAPTLRLGLARLELWTTPLVGTARLRLELELGAGGEDGALRLAARADSWKGLGGAADDDPALRVALQARGLRLDAVTPWLPFGDRVRPGSEAFDLELEVEGSRRDTLRGGLEVSKGSLRAGPLELTAPVRLEGRLEDPSGGRRLEGATLEAARARAYGVDARELRAAFALRGGALEVESLAFRDARTEPGGPGAAADASRLGVDVHVLRASRFAIEGLTLGAEGGPTLPSRLEARDLALVLEPAGDPDAPGLPLRVERLSLDALGPGRKGTLRLEARGGEDDRGRLAVRGRVGPWAEGTPLAAWPLALSIRGEALDGAAVAALLPPGWKTEAEAATPLEVEAELAGSRADRLEGPVTLAIGGGAVRIGDVEIGGPARVEGTFRAGGEEGPALLDARGESARALLGPASGRGVRAAFLWRDGLLSLERLDVEALRVAPPLRLGSEPGEGAALLLAGAEGLVAEGLRIEPGEPSETPPLPVRVHARRGALGVDPGFGEAIPPLDLDVETLEVEGLVPGASAEVRLAGRLVERAPPPRTGPPEPDAPEATGASPRDGRDEAGPRLGRVRGRAVLNPFAPDRPLAGQIRDLEVTLEAADAATLFRRLPEGVAPERHHGSLDARLRLEPSPQAAAARGRLELSLRDGTAVLAGLRFPAPARLEAGFALPAGGPPVVRDVEVQAAGGTWRQEGTLRLGDPPQLDATFSVADVALYETLEIEAEAPGAEGAPPPASPRLSGTLGVSGPLGVGDARFDALRGTGEVRVEGGELGSSELMRAVAVALARELGMTAGESRARRIPFERGSAKLRLEAGRLFTDDLEIHTREYRLVGRGSFSLAGDLRLDTLVSFRPAGVTRMLGILDVARPVLGDALRLPPVPVAVRGTLAEPRFTPDASRLPVAWVRGLLELPVRALGGAVDAVRRLGRGMGQVLGLEGEAPASEELPQPDEPLEDALVPTPALPPEPTPTAPEEGPGEEQGADRPPATP